MPLTATIGPVPPEWRQAQRVTPLEHTGASLLLLSVRIAGGSTLPLATGLTRRSLLDALDKWLQNETNKRVFLNYDIVVIPLILPAE